MLCYGLSVSPSCSYRISLWSYIVLPLCPWLVGQPRSWSLSTPLPPENRGVRNSLCSLELKDMSVPSGPCHATHGGVSPNASPLEEKTVFKASLCCLWSWRSVYSNVLPLDHVCQWLWGPFLQKFTLMSHYVSAPYYKLSFLSSPLSIHHMSGFAR